MSYSQMSQTQLEAKCLLTVAIITYEGHQPSQIQLKKKIPHFFFFFLHYFAVATMMG